ncbi:MAG: hypothetical protein ACOX4R_07400 [Lentihominibacter sp.]|jgi:hypothetical protein
MDKNALKEKRRETVISLLKGMRIRKSTEEGFDKEDVYTCIQQLCDLYETHIEELEKHYEVELTELTERCSKYDEKSLQYADIMMSAQKYHDDMVKQTNDEVYELMSNAQKQYEEKQLKIEDLRIAFESEKEVLGEELDAARNMAEAKRDAMRAEVEAEKEKLDAIKLRYRQQIDAMEEEFQEIRTNILRTATSLNGLKSQVSIADEGQWTVTEGSEVVEFPTPDAGIEEILDFPTEQEEAIPADVIEVEPATEAPFEEPVTESSEEEKPVAETVPEQPAEALFATDELFAEKFFKSEIMDNIGTPADELSTDIDAELIDKDDSELVPQEPIKADADIEELLEEISFEDIFTDLPDADKLDAAEPVEEISLEGIEEINPEELEEIVTDSAAEPEAAVVEEISLDDLEEIEKEVDQEATAQLVAEVAAVVAEEIDATADAVEESKESAALADEISFEGLEALFKDE